tara:strand:- start:330 stop:497 length:168 start_codon:yes stop_codon:yes gene_type:complete
MTLFEDDETHKKLTLLSPLETMFDHSKNILPLDYYWFSDKLPVGSRVKITFEIVE